jgi:cyclomaltodextrinase / maltogenic alpha-amylase / neopullulanase
MESRRPRRGGVRAAVIAAALALAGCVQPAAWVELGGSEGGEAWTFDKLLIAQAAPGVCEAVRFASPHSAVTAAVDGGQAMARLPLVSGDNAVTAECLQAGRALAGDSQRWDVRLGGRPTARVRVVPDADGVALDAGASDLAEGKPAPLVAYEWRARPDNRAPLAGLPAQGAQVTLPVPSRDGAYYVTLRVTDAAGRSDESTVVFRVVDGRARAVDLLDERPEWVERAVVYGVAPFFFGPRRLADVTARLDDLAELGITTLWLSPITAATEGDFGYAVTDFFRLRADFGSEADLRALIEGAHARGLRVIMDFVPNHVAAEHRYYRDAEARGADSPYFAFFDRAAGGEATYYFDWEHLINLNFDHPEVRRWVIEAFAYWVREFDVDGFRADVAWGPRERAPEFWTAWREELRRIKPDLLLLAEAGVRDPYYGDQGFDAAYDWTEALGEWAWRDGFESEQRTAALLREAIAASQDPALEALVFRFLNNNDTGARFVARYGPQRTRLAAVLLLTLPGLPMIYTGQEAGAVFEPYDEGPVLAWDDRHQLRQWYRRLVRLRAAHPSLRGSDLELLDLAPADSLLAYRRPGTPDLLVLLNWGTAPLEVVLPAPFAAPGGEAGAAFDLLTGERLNGAASVTLPPLGARLIAAPARVSPQS